MENKPNVRPEVSTPFGRPVYVMAKPAGPTCNLACSYCYYLEKKGLYPDDNKLMMSDTILETYIKKYIEA